MAFNLGKSVNKILKKTIKPLMLDSVDLMERTETTGSLGQAGTDFVVKRAGIRCSIQERKLTDQNIAQQKENRKTLVIYFDKNPKFTPGDILRTDKGVLLEVESGPDDADYRAVLWRVETKEIIGQP